MKISWLRLVREATLETLRLHTISDVERQNNFFSLIPRRTFAITVTKFPSGGVPEGVDCIRVVKILVSVSKPQ